MKNAINEIYRNRQNFILVALTGKIGTGCTTVADFMSESDHNLPIVNFQSNSTDTDRKKIIINNFYRKNWVPFIKLTVSDIMTLMLLEANITDLKFLIREANVESMIENYMEKKVYYNEKDKKALKNKLIKKYIDEQSSDLNNKDKEEFEEFEEFKSSFQNKNKDENKLNSLTDIFNEFKKKYPKKKNEIQFDKNFIINELPDTSNKIKKEIKKFGYRFYTLFYQRLGDNLRTFGKPSLGKADANNIHSISKRIDKIIQLIHASPKQNEPTHIVIDSLRNPIEIMFFKEKYSGFYLFSINSTDTDINSRLSDNLNMSNEQIKQQSIKENPDDLLNDMKTFVSQNIRDCVQKADVHISNSGNSTNNNNHDLYEQILKFYALIKHPGIITPSNAEKMMQIANTAKLNSGCLSRQVGAAVTNVFGALVSIGWNSVAQGQTPCVLRNKHELISGTKSEAYSEYEKSNEFILMLEKHTKHIPIESQNSDGLNHSFCFKSVYNKELNDKNQVHTRSLHAEENAFLQISKYGGEAIKNGTLYTTASPCELCSKKAYQLGIKNIVYIDPYPGIAKKQILNSGLNKPDMILFKGAIGTAYHRLYEQIIPYKDELEALGSDSCCS